MKVLFQWAKTNSTILINAGSLVGTTAVTSILGFAYWWLAARQFSTASVGLASAAISAMALLGNFSTLGLGTMLIGELPRQRNKAGSLISASLILVGVVGGGVGVAYAVVAPYLLSGFQALGASISNIALFASGVGLTALTLVLDQALIGLLRGEMQLWRNTLFAVVKLAALFATSLWISHLTGLTIYATWILGNILSLLFLALLIMVKRRTSGRALLPRWKLLRNLGTTALKHHTLNLTLDAPSLILPVLVAISLSTTANAWFYISWSLASIANAVSSALATTLYAVSSAQPSVMARKMQLTLRLALAACVLLNCVLLLGSKQVLGLFGRSYAEQAAWSLRVLSLESFPFILKNHYITLSRIQGQVGKTILLTVATGLFELGASIVGAHLGGLNGLSLGWTSAISIEAVFMFRTVYKAARYVERSPQVSLEQRSFGEQALWLVDTLGHSSILPAVTQRDIDEYQKRLSHDEGKARKNLSNEKQVLKPVRLRRFSIFDEETTVMRRLKQNNHHQHNNYVSERCTINDQEMLVMHQFKQDDHHPCKDDSEQELTFTRGSSAGMQTSNSSTNPPGSGSSSHQRNGVGGEAN